MLVIHSNAFFRRISFHSVSFRVLPLLSIRWGSSIPSVVHSPPTTNDCTTSTVSQSNSPHPFWVSEIFSSIQGEGPYCGRSSVFLRLGFCNLRCAWCDTKYTWLYKNELLERVRSSVPNGLEDKIAGNTVYEKQDLQRWNIDNLFNDIYSRAHKSVEHSPRAVVVTGGEPLLHKKYLSLLLPALSKANMDIEIETNGTLSPIGLPTDHRIHYNVSPKLSNSYQPQEIRIKPKILQQFLHTERAIFKFVVTNQKDINEVIEIVSHNNIPENRVYLMPEGRDSLTIAKRGVWVVDQCSKYGFNYSHRLHVTLWGDKRGV